MDSQASQPHSDSVRHSPPVADTASQLYTLSVPETQRLFDAATLPRSRRSITRYCETQRLDCTRADGPTGPYWKITEQSVERAIAELKRTFSINDEHGHSEPLPAMSGSGRAVDEEKKPAIETRTMADTVRHSPPVAANAGQGMGQRDLYFEQIELRIKEKDEVIGLLKSELTTKNAQIVARDEQLRTLLERDKETNILMQGFQRLMGLLPMSRATNDTNSGSGEVTA